MSRKSYLPRPVIILSSIVCLLLAVTVILSFSGFPKKIQVSRNLFRQQTDGIVTITVNNIHSLYTKHILRESDFYTLTLEITLSSRSERRVENTHFFMNCFNSSHKLVECLTGKNSINDPATFYRTTSALTKTPLDTYIAPDAKNVEYRPEFFGIHRSVSLVTLNYTDRPYSRTDREDTKKSSLAIKLDIPQ